MPVARKVALVIDALPAIGGAEKVLMSAMELYPDAPVYTLMYNREGFAGTPLAARRVIPSFIDRLPWARTQYRKYLPLLPRAIEAFDLSGYDLVLSFSYAVAHGVRVQPGQRHLSYTFTPMRYAWGINGLNGLDRRPNRAVDWLFRWFRAWDVASVARVERFAAVSGWIAHWVRCVYGHEPAVIYPPVEVERFSPHPERGDFYITVSRLVAHKRIDLIMQACTGLGLPLLVIGDGPERARLERLAGPAVRFLGFQPDELVAGLLGRARAFICAGKEDFGIAMVEAQAAGCPVIAYRMGGALETVIEGQSGLFFDEPEVGSLVEALERFEHCPGRFHPLRIAAGAERFNRKRFLEEFENFVEGA